MMDLRCLSTEPLKAPKPLPHVSRRALKRVREALAPPRACRYCGGGVDLVRHAEVYGRDYGDWPYLYICMACDAYVGLHPHTDLPLGTLADQPLRESRKRNKDVFEAYWRRAGMSRKEAYEWLAEQLAIDKGEAHWACFEVDACERAGAICRSSLERFSG